MPDEEKELNPTQEQKYKDQIAKLRKQLRETYREDNITELIRERCFNLSKQTVSPPDWLVDQEQGSQQCPGTPTLFLSDWHWAEVVNPAEVGFKNAYNIEISKERARICVEKTIEVLFRHSVNTDYPGLVLALGGDMVSGSIHDELKETNEIEIMPTVMDLVEVLTWVIQKFLQHFKQIFIPCVTGNHGRNTTKIRFKQRVYQSYDWLVYTMLEKTFLHDSRVQFFIPQGPDALYSVFSTRYLLTHGDMLGRGGDGLIGPIGPITRGDHRRRTRNSGLGLGYDVLICGHFHQLMMLRSRIVNGSLKGLDEYSFTQAFGYEPPMQALWMTHPTLGVTASYPIFCSGTEVAKAVEDHEKGWVAWHK